MIRFKSIISRIVILHVVAVVITSIFMSLALSWLMNYETDNIHNKAMQEQAVSVGNTSRRGLTAAFNWICRSTCSDSIRRRMDVIRMR